MKRVLIAEKIDEAVLAEFVNCGVEFVYLPDAQIENEIKGFDGLIVRPKPVSVKAIENANHLKLIIRGGAGVNSIALDACKRKGLIVENTPGLNSDATAEFTILLMLQLFARRHVEISDTRTRQGDPGSPRDYMGYSLKSRRLGLIGMGNIGKRVAKIAESFGMEVVAHSRSSGVALNELLQSNCDIISLHIPLTPETENIISHREFNLMKPGTFIINTARPQLIDVAALADSLQSGHIAGFGLDGDYEQVLPFVKIDRDKKGIITHHIADSTFEAQENITRAAMQQAVEFFVNGKEINRVS